MTEATEEWQPSWRSPGRPPRPGQLSRPMLQRQRFSNGSVALAAPTRAYINAACALQFKSLAREIDEKSLLRFDVCLPRHKMGICAIAAVSCNFLLPPTVPGIT